jgi:acyl-CoA thioesterase FadM
MIGGLQVAYVREIKLWRRFEVVSSIETWEGTSVVGRHRFVLDGGETAALILTTGGVYDRGGRRFLDIDEVVAALGHAASPRPPTDAERAFMVSHRNLREQAKQVRS